MSTKEDKKRSEQNILKDNIIRGKTAFTYLIEKCSFTTILDVGCGRGEVAKAFSACGKTVTTIDFIRNQFKPDIVGDYLQHTFNRTFDVVWLCHVLEHQYEPMTMLRKCWNDLKDNGLLVVMVPNNLWGLSDGHILVWNIGTLIYQMAIAGFDCSDCYASQESLKISVIAKKVPGIEVKRPLPPDFKEIARRLPRDLDNVYNVRSWRLLHK